MNHLFNLILQLGWMKSKNSILIQLLTSERNTGLVQTKQQFWAVVGNEVGGGLIGIYTTQ